MEQLNQSPEQQARDNIDKMLTAAGWKVQSKKAINFNAGPGIAVREYQTDVGPADYVLFVDQKAVGVVEAKPENWGQKLEFVGAPGTARTCNPQIRSQMSSNTKPRRLPVSINAILFGIGCR